MWLESISEPACDSAKCPTCGGHVQRRLFGEMHAGSFILDGIRVDIRAMPPERFMDPVVLDPLAVYFERTVYRLWPSEKYWARGGQRLHRDVRRSAFGDIPKGCHIHHRDNDSNNNSIANLVCVPAGEHLSEAWHTSKGKFGSGDHFTAGAREAAARWHSSEAGRVWHSRNATTGRPWEKWLRIPGPCEYCGVVFDRLVRKSGITSQKFCSQTCKALAYRKRRKSLGL